MIRFLLFFGLFANLFVSAQNPAVLNEMMSDNESTLQDDFGDYSDWIEIYNKGNIPILLEGYCLSDDSANLQKWTFPAVELNPGSFLLVFASDRDTVTGEAIHTNFKIDADGEKLFLSAPGGNVIDSLPAIELNDDVSYGRRPDGTVSFYLFDLPTPGYSNNLSNSLTVSHGSGFYTEPFTLEIASEDEQATIYYTLDGSIPGLNSAVYSQPLWMDYRYNDPNTISMIPTTPDSAFLDSYPWKPPVGQVDKAHVLRARSFSGNQPSSKLYSYSYFVDSLAFERYAFPVISLITDPGNLFDPDSGIYIPGNTWDPDDPLWTGNYNQRGNEWEREVFFEFFNESGSLEFYQDAGMKIQGKSTRRRPQKSLKISARSSYGCSCFNYPFFPGRDVDQYKSIILKNTFGCIHGTIIKDAMTHQLVRNLGFDIVDYRPVIVFVNGEYWGFQDLREDQDENYLTGLYGIKKDSLNLLENGGYPLYGSNSSYLELLGFVEQNDLSVPSNYSVVESQMDIGNYIDYQISEIYLNNYDWPGSNIQYWQSPKMDNRWRWLFFDLDFGWGDASYNMLEHATWEGDTLWPNPDWSTFLLRNLLKNDEFRTQFIDRFAELLNTLFQPDTLTAIIQQFAGQYEPEMQKYINRYSYPASIQEWHQIISYYLVKFAEERPCIMEDQIIEFFDLEEFAFHCDSNFSPGQPVDDFLILPNPSDGNFRLKAGTWDPIEVSITDSHGRFIFKREYFSAMGEAGIQINASYLEDGLYILQINFKNQVVASKLIITK